MTPYTFEEVEFLNKQQQKGNNNNMFTPKFEIPSYEEVKKTSEQFVGTGSEILGRCF